MKEEIEVLVRRAKIFEEDAKNNFKNKKVLRNLERARVSSRYIYEEFF